MSLLRDLRSVSGNRPGIRTETSSPAATRRSNARPFPPGLLPDVERSANAHPEPEQTAELISSTQSSNFDDSLPFDVLAEVECQQLQASGRAESFGDGQIAATFP